MLLLVTQTSRLEVAVEENQVPYLQNANSSCTVLCFERERRAVAPLISVHNNKYLPPLAYCGSIRDGSVETISNFNKILKS